MPTTDVRRYVEDHLPEGAKVFVPIQPEEPIWVTLLHAKLEIFRETGDVFVSLRPSEHRPEHGDEIARQFAALASLGREVERLMEEK